MPVMETFDAVSTGTLKMDFSYGPYWIGKLPMAIYSSGLPPFTLPRWEHYKVMYYELGLEKLLRKAYAKHNIYYIATIPTNNAVMLSKFPVNKAADLKGKKFRATGLYAEVLNAAGASAVYFPWGEIYGALEKGTIDGVIAGPLSSQADSGFHEPTKYFLETPITPVDAWCLHINMDAWKALPKDLQHLLVESASYAADLFTGSYFVHDVQWRSKIVKDFGFTVTSLSEQEQRKMYKYSMAVLDKYSKKDPIFAEATEILKKYMRDLGLLK
jgi:TRAP-type mannitol/chloroaromatic compound transport system substrate-binding protein